MKMNVIAMRNHQIIAEAIIDNGLVGNESGLLKLAKTQIQTWQQTVQRQHKVSYHLIHACASDAEAHNNGTVLNPMPDKF